MMAQIHFSRYQPLVTSSASQILGSLHTGYELSFNETTCSWKCRLEFKVYNTNNPQTKFEIKIYEVCWTASGCLLGLNTGATSEEYCYELEGIPECWSVTFKLDDVVLRPSPQVIKFTLTTIIIVHQNSLVSSFWNWDLRNCSHELQGLLWYC